MFYRLPYALDTPPSTSMAAHYKVHHHHLRFREVTVIANNATCPNGGNVLLCQSASYSCQDDGTGVQRCLERDDSFLASVDDKVTTPWAQCSQKNATLPSKCLFDFQCICMDIANDDCYCMPPDAWRTARRPAESCTTSSGEIGSCDEGKYCRTKGSNQECAIAPYLPSSTSLFSDCTNDRVCDTGLTCKDYKNFGICVQSSEADVSQN
ncbi:uncharacterized protein PHALS_07516 [Plasmopara halstedii]|uniref:Uncharacterized protein n=1 Tax=Plasmopara halstedii TaxID=4781 RepID=A0A0P1B7D3_PLAHL|nr:uncharacterized protein PHALS_07516 [Plasmopara halstedii]CEG49770.1 hypothetical protein PHALS_07516 [Plasmopara halstedii]|eukprot:XP_024586139.1 hypothetical protein PHALS_07516 [Plasmopara halstedii]